MDKVNQELKNEYLLYSWNDPGTQEVYGLAMSSSEFYVSDYQTLSVWNQDFDRVPLSSTFDVTDLSTDLLTSSGELLISVTFTVLLSFIH